MESSGTRRRHDRAGPAAQRWVRGVLRGPIRGLWPVQFSGMDNVPTDGAAILCPNHLSFFDSVFLSILLDRPVHFIGKAEYLDSWKTRWLFPAMGMIPIDRDSGTRAMIALDQAADVLREGAVLCIYPEGTRSRDGRLHRGYTGAARLAASVGCPLLPVGIVGTAQIQPPGAKFPRLRRRCSIAIGAPMAADAGRSAARVTTDALMQRIAGLSGQEYVAQYAPRTHRPDLPLPANHRRMPRLVQAHLAAAG